jgi:16S rRNA (cytidine1402-2'-O)-methyltransferase
MKPALLLLPNLLADIKHHQPYLPASVDEAVATIDGLIAESETAGRRYLGRFQTKKPAREIPIAIYNKKTPREDLDFLLEPIKAGERWGYVADAGLPCIADPGSELVFRAKKLGIVVQAFVGPSSLLLALMLSGLPAQEFAFHGYLPAEEVGRKKAIRQYAKVPGTHIFIETPYRNSYTLKGLLEALSEETLLCVASELTTPQQSVVTQTVAQWKKSPLPNLEKKAALFLF